MKHVLYDQKVTAQYSRSSFNTSIPISNGLFASINFPVSKRLNQFAQVSPMLPSGQPTVPSHRAVDREALVKGNQFWRNFEAPVCNKLFPFVLLV